MVYSALNHLSWLLAWEYNLFIFYFHLRSFQTDDNIEFSVVCKYLIYDHNQQYVCQKKWQDAEHSDPCTEWTDQVTVVHCCLYLSFQYTMNALTVFYLSHIWHNCCQNWVILRHSESIWWLVLVTKNLQLVSWLTLTLLTWRIWWAPNNASRWQMGFNSALKRLNLM